MSLDAAAKNISIFANLLAPIIEAGPELERIGSLQKYEQTLNNNIVELNKKKDQINDSIVKSRNDLEQEKQNHKNNVDKDLNDIKNDRTISLTFKKQKELEAKKIIEAANSEKTKIITDAKAEAEAIIDGVNKTIENQKKEIQSNNVKLASINDEINTRNKVLSDINEQLDKLRTK